MHRNMYDLQLLGSAAGRLADLDAEIARLHANGDRTDRDELLDERLDVVRFYDEVKAGRVSPLKPSIVGAEAAAVHEREPSSSDVPAAMVMHPIPVLGRGDIYRAGDVTGP